VEIATNPVGCRPPSGAVQAQIEHDIEHAIARVAEFVDIDFATTSAHGMSERDLDERLATALGAAHTALQLGAQRGGSGSRMVRLAEAAMALALLEADLRRERAERRLGALRGVQQALGRLQGLETVTAVMDRGLEELCLHCGFDRAVLFRVEGSEMVAEGMYFTEDPEWAAQILQIARENRPQLTHMLLETEMLRRRSAAIVSDAQNDPRSFKPIVVPIKTRSYVAAPIMPGGRVIGFVHADCYYAGRDITEIDRDIIWAFAEGFGYAVERAALLERLRRQREEIRRMMDSSVAVLDELSLSGIDLVRTDAESAAVARSAASVFLAPESRIDSLLTRRELEVLGLMADGATNARIADQLVISEGTVKSHVKHVLRKLRAANRAEAVSRYMRIVNAAQHQGD
jgi:DNA-binding CsgD family transcriptional regulator